MRSILRIKNIPRRHRSQPSAGFTLVELLIIAPAVVILVSTFVALMVTMVGDVLVSRDQTNTTYQSQDALDRIERDTRLSKAFLTTSGTLPSPQGSDSSFAGTAPFTNTTNTLILNMFATDMNPSDPARSIIYYANQPNACGSSAQTANTPFTVTIVYFINNGSLWRRVIVPLFDHNATVDAQTICSTNNPWQRNSCSPGYTNSTQCATEDEELVKNVSSLGVKYFANPISTTDTGPTNASTSTTIETTINTQSTTAGRTYTANFALRATRLN